MATNRCMEKGYFEPQYIAKGLRANVSRWNGIPILESYNETYDYWSTDRDLTREEVITYLGPDYVHNMRHPKAGE